jgi:hypothetical protein
MVHKARRDENLVGETSMLCCSSGKFTGKLLGELRPVNLPRILLPLLCLLFAGPISGLPSNTGFPPPPLGFRGLTLGMEIEQAKETLRADPLFRYRGDPDVSFLPQSSQFLIECSGTTYLRRAYLQFVDSRLFIMILVLDPQKMDHYSLFRALSEKYGEPTSLNPQESVWQSEAVRFSLERPLTAKYIDRKTFASLLDKGGAQQDLDLLSRDKFIEQF